MAEKPIHSDALLDTIENFLDTCPDLEEVDIVYGPRTTGENPTVRMVSITIGEDTYLVVAKRVGG